jgi:phosphoglycerol transferase MdoB-like AlkP superfamily enzyme
MPREKDTPPTILWSGLLVWLRALLIMIAVLTLARGILLIAYSSHFNALGLREIAASFAVGLRFDVAAALLTISLPLLLLWIPWPRKWQKSVVRLSQWLCALLVVAAAAVLWSDLLFWGESGRHLTVEPAGVLNDVAPVLLLAFREYTLELAALIIGGVILVRLVRWAFFPVQNAEYLRRSWWSIALLWLVVCTASFAGIRGSFGKEPLRSSDALSAGSEAAGGLALNGWYSFLYSTFNEQRPPVRYMDERESISIMHRLVAAEGDRFTSERFPLLRRSTWHSAVADSNEWLNVVLIVVESLNASLLESFGGAMSVMPFLDSLAQHSLIFTNCSAFGTRSFRGLCAITASVPNLGPNPYAITLTLPKLRGLGDILREQGYHIRFMHAAAPGSMGIEGICRMAGYEEFVTEANFPRSQRNGSWGVWDHVALERIAHELDSLPEPFHYGWFTLCTHAPWTLPKGFAPRIPPTIPGSQRLNTYAYLDQALRDFFRHETGSERFARTLYVIVGDHTSHAEEGETFRVACIFFAPGRLHGEVRSYPVSHLDVTPTVLNLCGIQSEHASFGRSMLDPDTAARFVVTDQSNNYGWQRGSWRLLCDADRLITLQNLSAPLRRQRNLLTSEPQIADSLAREFHAFYQLAEEALREDRVSQ